MTTNHRPTLESKRGRENVIRDTIQHSRSINSQTLLKLRLDISGSQVEPILGKRALDELKEGEKKPKIEETTEAEAAQSSSSASSGEESGSDYESEDDTEALMAELAKIRKEREDKKKEESALKGNPLLHMGDLPAPKKSWRSNTAFKRSKPDKKEDEFTTDTLNSDTHRKFLSKYVR